ncbi:AcrR family transcriptional regulator [Rhabdobacter roseus]|uniref:AcrR family transcriptional regulator n=1 Tax=Rhabdobacter roseus TaxID=1655419 RepID=A0A840TUX1_9BACT|nr:TetR/AcrR family transcriptional regulator [Rhabdobacter roseus]MBB5285447.1 AcrR family transcriptional regulator [Rhabdobacter roseus]
MKEKIVEQAAKVFNQKGIERSTLRDIAQELSISDGHLRYYFKTKESLILAIFSTMEQEIAALAPSKDTFPAALIEAMRRSFEIMKNYTFFFLDTSSILAKYPTVHAAYQALFESRKQLFLHLFLRLKEEGTFSEDLDNDLFPILFEQFFILSDNWVKYVYLAKEEKGNEKVDHYLALTLALLLPYFNSETKKEVLQWVKAAY